MKPFPMPKDLRQAMELQWVLREQVVLQGHPTARYIAALDASHPTRFSKFKGPSVAAAVLWDGETRQVAEIATASVEASSLFAYVPGLLSFRESPVYLMALAELKRQPELLLVDGHGIAHPRAFGIACHLGVHLDLPSIGVAKTLLFGKPEADLPLESGSAVRLLSKGEQIGWVYRSRSGVGPLYISPGHRIGMGESLELVRSLGGKTRLLEPLRQAHIAAGEARRKSDLEAQSP